MDAGELPPDCDARTRRLFDYWQAIRPVGQQFPGRRHFEPTSLPDLLRWLWLIDVQRVPLRFRCRLAGTGHREMVGAEVTGAWIDEMRPGFTKTRSYADFVAAAGGETIWRRSPPDLRADKRYVETELLVLPLAEDGATVDMLLGLTLYRRADGTAA